MQQEEGDIKKLDCGQSRRESANNLLIPGGSIGVSELCVPRWRRQRGRLLGFFSKKDKNGQRERLLVLALPIMSAHFSCQAGG